MPGIAPSARADVGKAHVIISERKDKKASKYLVRDLPYPYTSKAQFERSLEQPVGPEWNTRMAFQKGTLPKVVKKVSFFSICRAGPDFRSSRPFRWALLSIHFNACFNHCQAQREFLRVALLLI